MKIVNSLDIVVPIIEEGIRKENGSNDKGILRVLVRHLDKINNYNS